VSAVSDRRRGLVERIRTGELLRSGLCPVDGEPCDDDDDDDAIAAATAAAAGLMLVPAAGTDTRSGMLIIANNVLLSMIVISV
jgi:hypothetical protein